LFFLAVILSVDCIELFAFTTAKQIGWKDLDLLFLDQNADTS